MSYTVIWLSIMSVLLLSSCGGSSESTSNGGSSGTGGSGTSGSGTYSTEADAESARLSSVEDDLLSLINTERNQSGLPTLVRDTGLDTIMLWKVADMANNTYLAHEDTNGRGATERVQYYSSDPSARCSEIIQWWGGTASGQTHYDGYYNSTSGHHEAYMEQGVYNLGPTDDVGVAVISGNGPAESSYSGTSGSYSSLVFCEDGAPIAINPFE